MSNYSNVVGGKLKLKGAAVPLTPSHEKKKKKKKSSSSSSLKRIQDNRHEDEEEQQQEYEQQQQDEKKLTESELRHKKLQAKLEEKRIKEMIKMSHKEKVELYNKKLGQLSEHHDIPKVGPG